MSLSGAGAAGRAVIGNKGPKGKPEGSPVLLQMPHFIREKPYGTCGIRSLTTLGRSRPRSERRGNAPKQRAGERRFRPAVASVRRPGVQNRYDFQRPGIDDDDFVPRQEEFIPTPGLSVARLERSGFIPLRSSALRPRSSVFPLCSSARMLLSALPESLVSERMVFGLSWRAVSRAVAAARHPFIRFGRSHMQVGARWRRRIPVGGAGCRRYALLDGGPATRRLAGRPGPLRVGEVRSGDQRRGRGRDEKSMGHRMSPHMVPAEQRRDEERCSDVTRAPSSLFVKKRWALREKAGIASVWRL